MLTAPAQIEATRLRLMGAALFLATLVVFARALSCAFVNYDDPQNVTANGHVQGGLSWEGMKWALAGRSDYWQPVTWLSHMLDWQLWRESAGGHHATSVAIHAVNAVLLFWVLRRLTGANGASLACAAIFAWHPLRVESVVWITERKDVLSGAFFLLTVGAYTVYAERRKDGRPAGTFYAAALAAYALGLMSKPMLVTLPGVLLLLDFWPLGRGAAPSGGWRRLLAEKLPFLALAAGDAVVTFRMQASYGALPRGVPLDARLGNAAVSVWRYAGKFLWPEDLAVFYPHPGRWAAGTVAAAFVGLIAVTALVLWRRRTQPWLLVGWFWFLGMLVPVVGLVQAGDQSMADRYTYLPSIGLALAVVWTARAARARWAQVALATGLGLGAVAAAIGTARQIGYWRDSVSLFSHAVEVTKDNYVAEYNLGMALQADHQMTAATPHLVRAIEIKPDFVDGLNNAAIALSIAGEYERALEMLQRARTLQPELADTYGNLGMLYATLDRLEEAEAAYRRLLALRPDDPVSLAYLGNVITRRGRAGEATVLFQRAVALRPVFPEAHAGYGWALAQLGRREEAIREVRLALAQKPDYDDAAKLLQAIGAEGR